MTNPFKYSFYQVLILYLLHFQTNSHSCVSPKPYYEADSNQCYSSCPWQSPTKHYKYDPDMTCQETCPGTYFGFDGNRTCTQNCPNSPIQTFYDHTNKRCVNQCPANYFGYLGSDTANNQDCVQNCPTGTFSNFDNQRCVETCPSDTYSMPGSRPNCTYQCPQNYYASPLDRICKVATSCPTTPVRYFADDTTNLCVINCPQNYYTDPSTSRCVIFCSINYFSDDSTGTGKCVQDCPEEFYRDNVTRSCLRKCPKGSYIDESSGNCTQTCPTDTFGNNITGKCEEQCPYPTYGDSALKLCVEVCSIGTYADNYTQHCVLPINCHGNTLGDPTTHKCVNISDCPSSPFYFGDLVEKVCKLRCTNSLWGDRSTKMCLSECPWNPGTYVTWKNPDTQQCVTRCPQHPILYASNLTQTCQSTCPQPPNVPNPLFADAISQQCVETCPNGFSSQSSDNICVSNCDSNPVVLFYFEVNTSCISSCPDDYYADTSKQLCVNQCPLIPELYGYDVDNTCIHQCPEGYFADELTRQCVEACPEATNQYGDISTNRCVDKCPMIPDLYGQDLNDGNKTCVATCQDGYFADPLTRTCVQKCDINQGYYGQSPAKRCVLECSAGFQDNTTAQCVATCPRIPRYYYGNPVNKQCVLECPQFLYANNVTNMCVQPTDCQTDHYADDYSNKCVRYCPSVYQTFGEPTSKRCLQSCPQGLYADYTTRLCSNDCNPTANLFKDPSQKVCVSSCPETPALYADTNGMLCVERCTLNKFAYDIQRKCVSTCPSTPAHYGDPKTYRCLTKCPRETYIFIDNTKRQCVQWCPPRQYTVTNQVDLYADNSTWSCVPLCPKAQKLYNFKHPSDTTIRKCVKTCPKVGSTFYYAEDTTQSCVTTCPTPTQNTFADVLTLKCSADCTMSQFRDRISKKCTYVCQDGYFSDNTTWNCVEVCPQPYFGFTTNKTCLLECPTGFFAEPLTRMCRADCENKWYWYGDNTTAECVRDCPKIPNLFENPYTRMCNYFCTLDRYADNNTGRCVPAQRCSDGQVAETTTKRCVYQCPIQKPSFKNNDTNKCQYPCPGGSYADNSTMVCVDVCPSQPDFYAYNHTTLGPLCILYCPDTYYRHTPTRQCLQNCPGPDYFKDSKSMSCVKQCPDHTFAETIGQICIPDCGVNGKFGYRQEKKCVADCPDPYYADSTTDLCVKACPFTYYGQQNLCKTGCNIGFGDPITRNCEQECSLGYFAKSPEKFCTKFCQPHYAYEPDKTCLPQCPQNADLTLNLYKEPNSFVCVNKCLPGWYADNSQRSCTQTCSSHLFADNSTGLCVQKCPQTPDLYGYNRVCYNSCPLATHFAENDTRQCLDQCPPNSFADPFNRRCMDVCSGTQYAYDDPNSLDNLCLHICPNDFFASDHNKSCVAVCQQGEYGENDTNKCVKNCPQGSFADDFLNLCVSVCQGGRDQYGDPSTNKCVKQCPQVPSLYAQDNGRLCVLNCENDWFRLNTTRVCVYNSCPIPFYADPHTGYCDYQCQIDQPRFSSNLTRRCETNCPNSTIDEDGNTINVITYADNSTKRCVYKCPQYPRLYGYNLTNQCKDECPDNTFGDHQTRICHDVCFFGPEASVDKTPKYTWADSSTNFCVLQCPRLKFADNTTVSCEDQCTFGTYADNSTWRCVALCPVNPVSFADEASKICVAVCPDDMFGDQNGRLCSIGCPTTPIYYYRDYQNKRCARNCTFPYFADQYTQSCTTECQFGYFKNLAEHTCEKCPDSCISCQAELFCTACVPGLYMHDGQCIAACPTFPVRYFANDLSSQCVLECESPYFGFEGTGKCQIQCPRIYYSDPDTNKCQFCPDGCQYCFRDNCSSCLFGYIYVQQLASCSKICNSTHQYYVNGLCSQSCVEGTFLIADLVTCQACSKQCLACHSIGTNCTKCSEGFWYNFMCVQKCPENFYSDKDLKCSYCGDNNQNCQQQPFNFGVQTYTDDYKIYALIRFNRALIKSNNADNANQNAEENADDNSAVNSRRLLQEISDQQFAEILRIKSNGQPIKRSHYIVEKINSTTYRIQLLKSDGFDESELSFGFTPGVITDQFGNSLSQTEEYVQFETVTAVPLQTVEEVAEVKEKVNVASWIFIGLVVLLMINFNYPLMLLVDTVQTIYMHTFILIRPLPYLWFNVNTVLGAFHFNFLPKFYDVTESKTLPSKNIYSNFLEDTTFLGNMSPFIFFMAVFLGIYFILWILTVPKINRSQCFRKKVRKLFKARVKFSFIFEAFYYTIFYTMFFAIYQLKGYNDEIDGNVENKALAITAIVVYVAMIVLLIYASAKTKDKIIDVVECIKNRKRLPKMPKKYQFLVKQPSQFPMELLIRTIIKVLFCVSLQIENVQAQIILLLSLNLIFLVYILIFKPSMYKVTNRLNILLTLCFMALEIVIFTYAIGLKSTQMQQTTSIICLAISGFMILLILAWMLYRFVHYIREKCMGKRSELQMETEPIEKKRDYGKVMPYDSIDKQLRGRSFVKSKSANIMDATEKQINVSELNEQDQLDQEDEASANADQVIEEFAYHFVPAKTEGLIKAENKLLGKDKPKKKAPIVLQIDEDDLIFNEDDNVKEKRMKQTTSRKMRRTGQLRIQENYDDPIELSSIGSVQKKSEEKLKESEKQKSEDDIIWNIDIRSRNSES